MPFVILALVIMVIIYCALYIMIGFPVLLIGAFVWKLSIYNKVISIFYDIFKKVGYGDKKKDTDKSNDLSNPECEKDDYRLNPEYRKSNDPYWKGNNT